MSKCDTCKVCTGEQCETWGKFAAGELADATVIYTPPEKPVLKMFTEFSANRSKHREKLNPARETATLGRMSIRMANRMARMDKNSFNVSNGQKSNKSIRIKPINNKPVNRAFNPLLSDAVSAMVSIT